MFSLSVSICNPHWTKLHLFRPTGTALVEKRVRFTAKESGDGAVKFAAAGVWRGGMFEKGDKRGPGAIPAAAPATDWPLTLFNLFRGSV
jgi:hypothetical protein